MCVKTALTRRSEDARPSSLRVVLQAALVSLIVGRMTPRRLPIAVIHSAPRIGLIVFIAG